jgi:hypothetical protein
VRRHDGVAKAAPVLEGGTAVVEVEDPDAVTRFSATEGDRRFSNTPVGPTRR